MTIIILLIVIIIVVIFITVAILVVTFLIVVIMIIFVIVDSITRTTNTASPSLSVRQQHQLYHLEHQIQINFRTSKV